MTNVAILLAAGSGRRAGAHRPKQFVDVAGRSILAHSLLAFLSHPGIHEAIVVVAPDMVACTEEALAPYRTGKPVRVIAGGCERADSSLAAIKASGPGDANLLIHDAARPLVSHRIITDCIKALTDNEAVITAVDSTDTMFLAEGDRYVAPLDRRNLRAAQTPQCFRRSLIERAFRLAAADPEFRVTDDASVVAAMLPQVAIHIVKGDPLNFKVTYPDDLERAGRLLAQRNAPGAEISQ